MAVLSFVVFEQVTKTVDLSWNSSLACDVVEKNSGHYQSHSTRAYKLEGNLLMATEVTLRLPYKFKLSESIPSEVYSCMKREGLADFGADPYIYGDTPRVAYMMYDPRQLYLSDQRGSVGNKNLFGRAVLMIGEGMVWFKESDCPFSQALFGEVGDIPRVCALPGDNSPVVTLTPHFKQRTIIEQEASSRIVVSGDEVPQFLSLYFTMDSPKDIKNPKILLDKVTVELLEIIYDTRELIGDHRSNKDYETFFLRKKLLSKRELQSGLPLPSSGRFQLPPQCYDCKLPDIGPTFFVGTLMRGYAIRVSVDLHWNETKTTLVTFSEISVAKRIDTYLRREHTLNISYLEDVCKVRMSLMSMEKYPSDSFNPRAIGSKFFSTSLSEKYLENVSYQMDTLQLDYEVFTVTKVDLIDEGPRSWLKRSPQCPKDFGFTSSFGPEEAYLICAVVKDESSASPIGALVPTIRQPEVRYTFPDRFPLYSACCLGDLRVFEAQLTRCPYGTFQIMCVASFKEHRRFRQAKGDKIVLPGMRVSEFLRLSLILPMRSEDALGFLIKRDSVFVVTKFELDLSESIKGNSLQHTMERHLQRRLIATEPNRTFRWSDFEDVWPSQRNEVRSGGPVIWHLPLEKYDCRLPEVGPTFLSNEMYRSYELVAQIHVQVGDDQPMKMCVSQKIKIGVAIDDCISCPTAWPLPPPYEP